MNTKTTPATKGTAKATPKIHIHSAASAVDPSIIMFDAMPPTARLRVPTVAAVLGVSVPTVWRYAANGTLPRPAKLGGATTWGVGQIRQVLASMQA